MFDIKIPKSKHLTPTNIAVVGVGVVIGAIAITKIIRRRKSDPFIEDQIDAPGLTIEPGIISLDAKFIIDRLYINAEWWEVGQYWILNTSIEQVMNVLHKYHNPQDMLALQQNYAYRTGGRDLESDLVDNLHQRQIEDIKYLFA